MKRTVLAALAAVLATAFPLSAQTKASPARIPAAPTPHGASQPAPAKKGEPTFAISQIEAAPGGLSLAPGTACDLTGYEGSSWAGIPVNYCVPANFWGVLSLARAKVTVTQTNPLAEVTGKTVRLAVHDEGANKNVFVLSNYHTTAQGSRAASAGSTQLLVRETATFFVVVAAIVLDGREDVFLQQGRAMLKAGRPVQFEVQYEGKAVAKRACVYFEPPRVTCY